MPKTFAAFSGGKDSVEMVYGMKDAGEEFSLLFTPTGNELPELIEHVNKVAADLAIPLIIPPGPSLFKLIEEFEGLPNWRQRWCTKYIKIFPCMAYLKQHPGSTLCVGLRADEEERLGLYGKYAHYRYPLRERGMDLAAVLASVKARNVSIPIRTDCALCYGQKLIEWRELWARHPELYAQGESLEEKYGHTFRSDGRDAWPADLKGLRLMFEAGHVPRSRRKLPVQQRACGICIK